MPRILTIGPIVAAALVFASVAAAAVTSPTYQVTGIGLGAQGDVGSLFGVGTGSTGDRAQWRASIAHAPLAGCATVGASCGVTGGTLTLTSNNGSSLVGTVTGGAITLTAQAARCGTQTFAVVTNVSAPSGTEQLTGVLTNYRFQLRGACTVLASTVQGALAQTGDGNTF
jgi:hypothetical protein